MGKPKTLKIDDVEYVRASDVKNYEIAEKVDGMEYVIIRTYSAGCHAGYLSGRNGKEVTLKMARRLWYWDGAASLSQLAKEGPSKPGNCKFPCEVDTIILTEAIEIIPCTETAKQSIRGVSIWKA